MIYLTMIQTVLLAAGTIDTVATATGTVIEMTIVNETAIDSPTNDQDIGAAHRDGIGLRMAAPVNALSERLTQVVAVPLLGPDATTEGTTGALQTCGPL
jgi:hypothetical protein